ncbi:uncharacterized protein PHALS_15443 [Plasmopara halstedii]|uniref:Uncharacterized protein n=1 Tax=Plasmopara halstedii TaxID=4781 RepID=A0A0P1AHZ5_PLAHL|nr:uncharacterized protein PHALS_15443 [Plasmopara halstedii]CEG40405.1 hypothetical protein PHALS_15443 [Plasmopara halstedii]|eukprot:XP_024576774.1 hypothetical protein PHALS_15443 [Plasmopara halstedii]
MVDTQDLVKEGLSKRLPPSTLNDKRQSDLSKVMTERANVISRVRDAMAEVQYAQKLMLTRMDVEARMNPKKMIIY